MACAFAPWAYLAGRRDELRRVVTDSIEAVRGRWSGVIGALPLVRTLHAADEPDLLEQVLDSMQPTSGVELGAKLTTSHLAAQAFVARRAGDAERAAGLLERAAAAERALGYAFDAAVLELDLAEALQAAGDGERAPAVRDSTMTFIGALGCVNPL
jgi:hypothetical protein